MTFQLNKNVNLHILPTEKYKTVRVLINFSTPVTTQKSSQRSLLASVLETNSLNYPNQTELSKKLADLYGASFGIYVGRNGNHHNLTVSLNIINDTLVPSGTSVLEPSVAFLKDILFQPNMKDDVFEQETFTREQDNLVAYIESIFDDKQALASLSLQQLYFDDQHQRTPSFGDIETIKKETAQSLADYYTQMIQEDQVDILVIGNVAEGYVQRVFKDFGFSDREVAATDMFYYQDTNNIIKQKTEVQPVVQSKLNIAYHTDIYYYDDLHFPLLVFNGLFGGFPHSKLFLNVREKHSLAYYASSSTDPFRGLLTVQTGIDGQNREKVLRLVNEQLKQIVRGNVAEEELEQTKIMLKNQYLLSQDSQRYLLDNAFLRVKVPRSDIPQDEVLTKIDAVSLEDVQLVAKKLQLQAVYFLEGEKH